LPVTASRPVDRAGPSRRREVFASCGLSPPCVHPASLCRFLVLSRGARCAGTPPCKRLVPLYPRGPRSGPGYSVPVHQHLIGPIRPTRKHISISPTRLIRDALAVRRTYRLGDPRVVPCFRWLSLSACRPQRPREADRLQIPSSSPTALAFDLRGRSRHFHHPPPSDSCGGVHFEA
jgi:hypothetical protein